MVVRPFRLLSLRHQSAAIGIYPITSLYKARTEAIAILRDVTDGIDPQQTRIGIVHKGGPKEGRQLAIHLTVLRDWIAE
ncbi:integrase arm-type DNA-binding domain-containing protein [Parasphingorhabdus sp.]|uniref:integrase arm-type DNA-binding domain-containing protein n=1 Tax=Parasphingorhabdus sp. TaxID=2709688 RepID=UPI0039C8CF71